MRTTQMIRVLAAVTLLGLFAGCQDKSPKPKVAPAAAVAAPEPDPVPPPVEVVPLVPIDVPFQLLPKDSESVVVFSLTSLRQSSIWPSLKKKLLSGTQRELLWMREQCGLEPLELIDIVVVAGNSAKKDETITMVRGLTRQQVRECAAKDSKLTLKEEGNLSHVTLEGKDRWIAWIDDRTLLVSPDNSSKKYIEARASGKDGLDTNKEMMSLIEETKRTGTLFFAILPAPGSKLSDTLAKMPFGGTKGLFGTVVIENGLEIEVGSRFQDAELAVASTVEATSTLAAAKLTTASVYGKYIDRIVIQTKGRDLRARVKLSPSELIEVGELFGGLMASIRGQL